MRLRCAGNKVHGHLDDKFIEVKCNSRWCGAKSGVTVLHKFSLPSGELINTEVFKDPDTNKKRRNDAARHGTSVRSA